MSNKYKSGIIGMGNIGYKFKDFKIGFPFTHFEAYKLNFDTQLIAVCDSSEKVTKKEVGDVVFFSDYKEMFKFDEFDIVSICTPDESHYEILKFIAENTNVKGVWCEKPITLSLLEAVEVIDLYKKKNIKLLVNYTRRYDEFYQYTKDSIHNLIGDIKSVSFFYSGGLVTVGSHMCDLLDYFFGPYESLVGFKKFSSVQGIINFPDGISVQIVPIENSGYAIFEMNILGTKGRLDIINKPFNEYDYRYYVLEHNDKIGANWIGSNCEFKIPRDFPRNFMENALKDLINAIEKDIEPKSTGVNALTSLEIISALWYSAESGTKVVAPFSKKVSLPASQGDVKLWKKKS